MKPIHVKPAFYSFCYEQLKSIAATHGYNLVLHGSMNRDLDLILIPWDHTKELPDPLVMIGMLSDFLGGTILEKDSTCNRCGKDMGLGRKSYVININRGGYVGDKFIPDPQWYLDISVTPIVKS